MTDFQLLQIQTVNLFAHHSNECLLKDEKLQWQFKRFT